MRMHVFVIVTMAVAGLGYSIPAHAASLSAHVVTVNRGQVADPCGFRYAVWPVAQSLSAYVDLVDAGSTDEYGAALKDSLFTEYEMGLPSDYHTPRGAKKISDVMDQITVAVDEAVVANAESNDSDFVFAIGQARAAQRTMWRLVNAMCSWKGKAFTWTGWLNQYGTLQVKTREFTVPNGWAIEWDYWCPEEELGTMKQSDGNFIVERYSAAGQFLLGGVNDLSIAGGGLTDPFRRGTYYLKINSECAWHVKVRPQ